MARKRRSGASRAGIGLLVLLALLLGLVVIGDRVAAAVAEDRAAEQLQRELGTATTPEVDIEGFPFLTQALDRSLKSVHIVADGVQPPDRAGTALGRVDLRLQDVTSADNYRTVAAGEVTGSTTLDYESVKQVAGYPIAYAEDGRVQVTSQATVFGNSVEADVVGLPVVDVAAQTLSLGEPTVNVGGVPVPDDTAQGLLQPVPLKGIPYGLSVTEVTASPEGLRAGVAGRNVTFQR